MQKREAEVPRSPATRTDPLTEGMEQATATKDAKSTSWFTYLLWRSSKFIVPGVCASEDNVMILECLSGDPDLLKNTNTFNVLCLED